MGPHRFWHAAAMSHWVLEYRYADPDARARVRPDHLAYMNGLHEDGRVVMGGPVGDGAHARHEHVVISGMIERAALLAGLLLRE